MKYVITFKFSNSATRFYKHDYECYRNTNDVWMWPTLSEHKHLIPATSIFDSVEDAQKKIDSIVESANKELQHHIKHFVRVKRDSWEYNKRRNYKRFSDASKYGIVEYEPEFMCKKERKTKNKKWAETGGAAKFCHLCGNNILTKKFFLVGYIRMCPFCISELNEKAKSLISELKKEIPDAEDQHAATRFLAHMD